MIVYIDTLFILFWSATFLSRQGQMRRLYQQIEKQNSPYLRGQGQGRMPSGQGNQ